MTMSLSFPESSAEISSAFIETLVLIHRNFYRNLTIPVPLNQFATLMTLRLEKQATLSEIGQRLQISKQQMTNICDKLLHAGLITKRQDSEDRRRMLISMTSAGEKILDDQNEAVFARYNFQEKLRIMITDRLVLCGLDHVWKRGLQLGTERLEERRCSRTHRNLGNAAPLRFGLEFLEFHCANCGLVGIKARPDV